MASSTSWVLLRWEDCCSSTHDLPAWLILSSCSPIPHLPEVQNFLLLPVEYHICTPCSVSLQRCLGQEYCQISEISPSDVMADAMTPPKSLSKSPTGSKPASPTSASLPGQDPALSPSGPIPAEDLTHEEPVHDDDESALGGSISSTASVASSILNYRTLHGWRYHSEIGDAAYW